MKRLFSIVFLLGLSFSISYSQSLIEAEYFFDQDPGPGNGIAFTFPKSNSVNLNLNFPVSSLSLGSHDLYVRIKDSLGRWSIYENQSFFVQSTVQATPIVELEYFFDQDPGPGNGISLGSFFLDSIDQNFNISTTGLSLGSHDLYIRMQDSSGAWSIYENQSFFISQDDPSNPPRIVGGEYFVDQDPGPGLGTPFSAGGFLDSVDLNLNIDISPYPVGIHYLYIRLQDSSGKWSIYETDTFEIALCLPPAISI